MAVCTSNSALISSQHVSNGKVGHIHIDRGMIPRFSTQRRKQEILYTKIDRRILSGGMYILGEKILGAIKLDREAIDKIMKRTWAKGVCNTWRLP